MTGTPGPEITPFRVAFESAAIADLRGRLRNTRWPEHETVEDWSQGAPLSFVQDLAAYWSDDYDFANAEARMNAWPQFKTRIDDLDIHFVHARSPEPTALPLVITHGFPGSYVEFLDVIGALTDPVAHGGDAADAFHVVCPSLPGYGFSDRPSTRGRGVPWVAEAWATLMARLGYDRYGAQGGDWGSAVTSVLGQSHQDHVVGIHVNMPTVMLGPLDESSTEQEKKNYEDFEWHTRWGTGYQQQQSTRPQTLGYGLVDSPVGQLAWVTEKYWAWTDCDGNPYNVFTREQLLDNATVYWFTGTGASSTRLYWESAGPIVAEEIAATGMAPGMGLVTVPTGCSVFPKEIRRPSRRWAEQRFKNIHYWGEPAKGGHFAAFEQPEIFVNEVRSSFRSLR
jgi:epoxide hydrolase